MSILRPINTPNTEAICSVLEELWLGTVATELFGRPVFRKHTGGSCQVVFLAVRSTSFLQVNW